MAVTSFAECFVSVKRIEDFLLMPDHKIPNDGQLNYAFTPEIISDKVTIPKAQPQRVVNVNEFAQKPGIIFENVTASWSKRSQSCINSLRLDVHGNQLIAITGSVAAGKTSMFLVILRELEIDSGELTVDGVVSYSSQEPWLFDATIRQNILFTESFDDERYQEVIRVCSLERDIRSFPAGDLTFVGESGACLSGGQKSRINLARAIYRKADIYLLDDPLAAVDSTVSKKMFKNCIKDFLKDKICLLITHQKQCIKAADRVIYFRDGKIELDAQQIKSDDDSEIINSESDDEKSLKEVRNELSTQLCR